MARVDVTVWRYELPPIEGEGWGSFMLDSTGMFAAVTDYGNYAYRWSHFGQRDFREFLAKASGSHEYILEKVAPSHGKEYQGKETEKAIKERILEARRNGWLTQEEAKYEWWLLEQVDLTYKDGFHEWWLETKLPDAAEYAVYDFTATEKAFAYELMPRLAEILKKELEQENVVTA